MRCRHIWTDQGPFDKPGIFFCCFKCKNYKEISDDGKRITYLKSDDIGPLGFKRYYNRTKEQ